MPFFKTLGSIPTTGTILLCGPVFCDVSLGYNLGLLDRRFNRRVHVAITKFKRDMPAGVRMAVRRLKKNKASTSYLAA